MNAEVQAKVEALGGSVLAATPLWLTYVQDFSVVCGAIASFFGAIVAIHGFYRIVRRYFE